jgi:putative ABC transport system substrate-binding protein
MLEDSTMGLSTIGLLVMFALGTVWPLLAASPKKVPTIGVLAFASPPSEPDWKQSSVFLQELRHLGYVEGQNIRFEWRFADQRVDRLHDLAGELVRLKVDVIVAPTEPATSETQHATTTIPIVMAGVNNPVALGFVKSLAHPGGNITGVTALGPELVGKQLELLKATVPEVTKIGVLGTPGNLAGFWPEVERTAQALDVQLQVLVVRGPEEVARVFALANKRGAGAVLILPWVSVTANARWIAELAVQSQLPTIYWSRVFAEVGGFMAYGASNDDLGRRVAYYVDRILQGTKPADLPVEQPTKFALVINLKTAKALGRAMPPTLLMLADEVIR